MLVGGSLICEAAWSKVQGLPGLRIAYMSWDFLGIRIRSPRKEGFLGSGLWVSGT